MPKSADKFSPEQISDLHEEIQRLKERLGRQKDLETRLNETLHSLRVHEEELRTQNEDLITAQKEITQSQRKYRDLFDDEEMILDVSGKLLERLGYRVIAAENGEQAVEIYQKWCQDVDLVILDMIMPAMSGFETYNRLKEINPQIKVLLSSGYSEKGQAGEIVARDRQDFIQKPFDLTQLSQKIAMILTKQKSVRGQGSLG